MTIEEAAERLQAMFRANSKFHGYPEVTVIPFKENIQIHWNNGQYARLHPFDPEHLGECLLHLGFSARDFAAGKFIEAREAAHLEQYRLLIGGLIKIAERVSDHLDDKDAEEMEQAIAEFREKAKLAGVEA